VADRAGHAMHTAMVSRLMRDPASWELVTQMDTVPEAVHV